jgi:FkbM family methyltransferase
MKLTAPWRTLRHFLDHPLGRRDRVATLTRIVRWQLGSRLLGTRVAMPFVDSARLLVGTGMHGATGNVYVGLMEFEDMAFVLHLVREGDQFLDVGANVGVYSVLAASRGARVLAVEPVPATYEQLLDNIHLNRFEAKVEARNVGVGRGPGELRFTTGSGPTDHVLAPGESAAHVATVAVDALDTLAAGWTPVMMKIDVEGFEANVIAGAAHLLNEPSLQAVLIELNGLGARYGFNNDDIHNELLSAGFHPASYEPFARRLTPLEGHRASGNTLYVRNFSVLEQRLRDAPTVQVVGVDV